MSLDFTPSDEERFWPKADTSGGPDSCWPWTAAKNAAGYGKFGMNGRAGTSHYAHRIAYQMVIGPIPEGLVIDHLCRNTSCVNPSHLETVLPRENTLRGVAPLVRLHHEQRCINGHPLSEENVYWIHESRKGGRAVPRCKTCRLENSERYRVANPKPRVANPQNRGDAHHSSKLTADDVRQIRAEYATGTVTLKQLAERYSVAFSGISAIVRRKTWKHVA